MISRQNARQKANLMQSKSTLSNSSPSKATNGKVLIEEINAGLTLSKG
jgi:hypothetical protein